MEIKSPTKNLTYIKDSWLRSKELGINPDKKIIPLTVGPQELLHYQKNCEPYLSLVTTEIKTYLNFLLTQTKLVLSLANSNGLILYLDGMQKDIKECEQFGYRPGVMWTEDNAGTNALGLCAYLKKPVTIKGHEHFLSILHGYEAASFPIFFSNQKLAGILTIGSKGRKSKTIKTLGYLLANLIEKLINEGKMAEHLSWYKGFANYLFSEMPQAGFLIDMDGSIIFANIKASASFKKMPSTVQELEEIWQQNIDLENDRISQPFAVEGNKEITISCNTMGSKKLLLFQQNPIKNKMTKFKSNFTFNDFSGGNCNLQNAIRLARKVAASDTNILIEGETGTGKEMFAQAIHHASHYSNGPFVAINCGALPKDLVLGELFGYEEGAFTGAKKGGNAGKFELASGGTLFLDEIGELALDIQVMLLRVLQEKEVTRLGGHKPIYINARIISATNRNLLNEIQQGRFRMDLFYRLNVVKLELPPLRQYPNDILILWDKIIQDACIKLCRPVPKTTQEVRRIFVRYSWPGNVRELKNIADRVAVLAGNCVLPEHLPTELTKGQETTLNFSSLKEMEKNAISSVLLEINGNLSIAAKVLGLSRPTLYKKIKEYEIYNKIQ